jgi:hypothetical protein
MSGGDNEKGAAGPERSAGDRERDAAGPGMSAGDRDQGSAGSTISARDLGESAAGPRTGAGGFTREGGWRPATFALAASLLLHTATVLWVWHSWGGFGRGGVLAWIDFPSSLAYLRLRGGAKLAWSLLVGGAQWAVIGAGLSLLLGRSARPPADRRPG